MGETTQKTLDLDQDELNVLLAACYHYRTALESAHSLLDDSDEAYNAASSTLNRVWSKISKKHS